MTKNATENIRNTRNTRNTELTRKGLQLTLPLPEQLHEELYGVVTRLGLLALEGMLQCEVEALCGARYGRGQGDRPARSGTARGSLALGGRRVEVRRPRVRKDGKEVHLETWEQLDSEDPLNRRAIEQMVIGVSTRKYRRSLEDLPADVVERGTSKSAVSRRFVAETGKKLDEWMHRDLSGLDLASIMIDGLHVDGHVVLVALGFDTTGSKHLLGIHEGATENRESCKALVADLVERGVDSSRCTLFVLDGAKALRRAVLDVFGKRALVQRCQVHKRRNILEHLPEEKQPSVENILKEAFRAASSTTAKSRLEALAGRLAADYPSAAESIREGLDELFTVKDLGVPEDLVRAFSTTNAIENVNNGIRRITRRVKRWRGGTMILRWIGAALQELQAGFHRVKGFRGMKELVAALRARDAALNPSADKREMAA
jgi:transposase-like protein